MTARVGIVVLGASDELGDALVGAVAAAPTLGEVRAVEAVPRDVPVGPAAARLAEVCELVVGLGALPFPGLAARHDALRDALGDVPYWAVETWHGLPSFHDALADVVAAALAADRDDGRAAAVAGQARTTTSPHVLVTAPDEVIRTLPPEHRVVLRDVAAALHDRVGRRPTIAVDRSAAVAPVTPTAVETLTTLVEAHGATAVVRCSLVPGDGPDDEVTVAARLHGVELTDVAIDRDVHVRLLLEAVTTVLRQAVAGGPADGGTDAAPAGPSDVETGPGTDAASTDGQRGGR